MKKKIYVFSNGGNDLGMLAVAVAEDGKQLAGHICSNESFIEHDLGVTSKWHHESYDKHYGKGNWELVYLKPGDDLPECLKEKNKETTPNL